MVTGSTSGFISPPLNSNGTYPNQLFCHWKLIQWHWTSNHGTLKLTLDQLNLENGGCHDSLTYVRGQDLESGKLLKRLCGTELDESPTVVLSPGHEVTHVVFKSDYSINNRGFNVSYQVKADSEYCICKKLSNSNF